MNLRYVIVVCLALACAAPALAQGNSANAPGQSNGNNGNGSDSSPGNSGNAPGNGGSDSPGNSGNAPGQSNSNNGNGSDNAPGNSGTSPGNSGNAPGEGGAGSPGNSGNAPGQSSPSLPAGGGSGGAAPATPSPIGSARPPAFVPPAASPPQGGPPPVSAITLSGDQVRDAVASRQAMSLADFGEAVHQRNGGEIVDANLLRVRGMLVYALKVLDDSGRLSIQYFYARSGVYIGSE
ncbi:hypothetical protein SAMN06295905_1913 [Devosia lucknowensis]|uniref:Peptidase propeptide and YPEB domain-containing protein n=1 Tax=Devosia lucknowensis TaxID=1096929 RepID=A0A1Y6FEB7_9HYPH|nr:hypothetical protein [Devosia lucknowensis]SMQ70783.1 hypothetical protein SAMN06295905_1913 [Devosia lucknowensis]